MAMRREIAQRVLDADINWQSDGAGFLLCPGEHLHTAPTVSRDCILYLDGAPTLSCFHQSCREVIAAANQELRSAIGKAEHGMAAGGSERKGSARRCKREGTFLNIGGRLQHECESTDLLATHASLPTLLDRYQMDPGEWLRLSPVTPYKEPAQQWRQVLTLFEWEDLIWIGPEVECSSATNPDFTRFFQSMRRWQLQPAAPGKYTCPSTFKPGTHSRSNVNVASRPFLVVESDLLRKPEISAVFQWLGEFLRLRAIVDTAGKSLHGWFDTPGADTLKELQGILPQLGCDPALFKPSQPCRLPGALRGSRYQSLLFIDPARRRT